MTALESNEERSIAISIQGKVRELGEGKIPDLFRKNPYMEKIYPTEEARKALTVFEIYEGNGEYFVLYIDGLQRESFTFGAAEEKSMGYEIVKECIGCETCLSACPQQCIFSEEVPFRIDQRHCLHCGNCFRVCPVGAVRRRKSHG